MGQLKEFLLTASEPEIKGVMYGLTSDTIGCVPKLMSNQELIALGQKIFNVLPGTRMGAKGYMGARIQPNSPTDHPEDVAWQVFDAFAYATGDIVIGTNPVDSTVTSVVAVERALKDIVDTFKLEDIIPWCVLSHIDVQAEVDDSYPGTVATMFQSLAGTDDCNKTFDVTVEKILKYAKSKTGRTIRALLRDRPGFRVHQWRGERRRHDGARVPKVRFQPGRRSRNSRRCNPGAPGSMSTMWPDSSGPEVFKSREQLVRCCLEDIAMGKLHGLTIGLDICSTLHMTVSLEDLDWCQDQIMPANPVYLIALPTKNDPMLGYLTTSFQDHVRLQGKVRLQGQRCDVGFLQADRDRRSERQIHPELRRSALGVLPVPAGQG